jgi:anthranilate synthase component 2
VAHGARSNLAPWATGPVPDGAAEPGPLIVLIDNYDSFTWNLAHLLVISGARVEVVRNDEVTAAQVADAAPAGVVISPGPCAPAEAGISMAAVTACVRSGIPLLGICLGHEAIGAAFGARIVPAPHPVHGRASAISHDGQGVLAGLPDPFQATRYHSLLVDEFTLPVELAVTARTGNIPMGIRHRTLPVEGIQFHPESILTAHGAAIIANFTRAAAAPDVQLSDSSLPLAGGESGEESLLQKATQEGEQFLNSETGNKFDSEIRAGGNVVDEQVDKELPNL